jgi:hypothetical protein
LAGCKSFLVSPWQRGSTTSGHTVKCDVMKRHREQEDRIGKRLRNAASKISVTLDCWTSSNNKTFLGITVVTRARGKEKASLL